MPLILGSQTVPGYYPLVHYLFSAGPRSVTVGGTDIMAQAKRTTPTLHPLHDRVLVKRVEEEPTRRGGIIIPDSAKEKPQEGKVIAVGKGKVSEAGKKTPLDVKAGDRVLFGKYSGSEVKLDGEEYLIMKEEDVLGILAS
jgi:chaperonin GroES